MLPVLSPTRAFRHEVAEIRMMKHSDSVRCEDPCQLREVGGDDVVLDVHERVKAESEIHRIVIDIRKTVHSRFTTNVRGASS